MKLVVQRVKQAQVSVDGEVVGSIAYGMVVFLGIAKGDTEDDIHRMVHKIIQLRMFDDGEGKMNRSAREANAGFLIVSQFTLLGNCEKGRRPSFDDAADPKTAEDMYERFVVHLSKQEVKVATGRFKAMMEVSLVNDGPVTFVLESR